MTTGSCHCGAVRISIEAEPNAALECNCSHCSRKGLLLWFLPRGALAVSGDEYLATYTFNRHVIEHRFCRICGCQPFALGHMPDGAEAAAINVRCLDDVDIDALPRTPYDGRAA